MKKSMTLSKSSSLTTTSYFSQIGMIFVGLLLTANVIGEKPLLLGGFIIPAGLLVFPLTYLVGDVLTEVYGFALSRRVIWMGLICNLFMAFMCRLAISLPALESWEHNAAYARILGVSSKLMLVSVFTYCVGEFINAYIVARLKVKFQGRYFWARALCGSWIGEGIETTLFMSLAFYGTMPNRELIQLATFYYSFKVLYAFFMMPIASKLVKFLKQKEGLEMREEKSQNLKPIAI